MTASPILLPFDGKFPRIAADAFVAPGATLVGDIEIGAGSSIWYGCVLRADFRLVRVGRGSNLQDGTVVHIDSARRGTNIGDDVLIGHQCLIHACDIEDGAFIGMKACVMDDAVVESGAMVAAGALVPPRKRVKRGELWAGSPAKLLRAVSEAEMEGFKRAAQAYAALAQAHRQALAAAKPARAAE